MDGEAKATLLNATKPNEETNMIRIAVIGLTAAAAMVLGTSAALASLVVTSTRGAHNQ